MPELSDFTAPCMAQDYLHQLTRLVNFVLSGKAPNPWLCGASITGVRPMTVCETAIPSGVTRPGLCPTINLPGPTIKKIEMIQHRAVRFAY